NVIGHVNKSQLLTLYRQSDIFVLPSIKETFGLVYPEAMSQGLPVIYTKGQGFDKQFQEGQVGYSINCLEPDDIAEKILFVIERYNELSIRSTELVERFSWERIVKDYQKVYEE